MHPSSVRRILDQFNSNVRLHVAVVIIFFLVYIALVNFTILRRCQVWNEGVQTTSWSVNHANRIPKAQNSIVVLVPPVPTPVAKADDLSALQSMFLSLSSANYPEPTNLRVLLARDYDDRHRRLLNAVHHATVTWKHGTVDVSTLSSPEVCSLILDAWNPTRKANETCVIIDAYSALRVHVPVSFNPHWFSWIRKQRALYAGDADIAALSPFVHPGNVSIQSRNHASHPYLYANALGAHVLAPMNAESWLFFLRWFSAHRSEWFLWPTHSGAMESAPPPVHWAAWYTRFLAEHQLFVLYGNVSNTGNAESHANNMSRFAFDGSIVREDELGRANDAELEEIVKTAQEGDGSVSITIVTKPYLETARSFICNVQAGGFMPKSLVWITTDEETYDTLRLIKGTHAVLMRNFYGGRYETGTAFLQPGYWLLMLERTRLIRDLVLRNVAVFLFETDQVWLRDPAPYIHLHPGDGTDVDLIGTFDSKHMIAGNFLYVNPTYVSKTLWREIARRFSVSYHRAGMHQQRNHRSGYQGTIENDQSILTHLVLHDTMFKVALGITFRALDSNLFVDGRWYQSHRKAANSPVVINNNYIIGIPAKISRAKTFGHWFWNGHQCNTTAALHAIWKNHFVEGDNRILNLRTDDNSVADKVSAKNELVEAIAKSLRV